MQYDTGATLSPEMRQALSPVTIEGERAVNTTRKVKSMYSRLHPMSTHEY